MKTVITISADSEWRAVKEILAGNIAETSTTPFGETFSTQIQEFPLTFLHGGWGKISAAATTQYAIDHFKPDLLVNLGTCGGLDGQAAPGDILLVERTLIYDIIEQMGDEQAALEHYATQIDLSWLKAFPLPARVRREQMVSADRDILREDVPMLIERYQAPAADWESGAIAWVTAKNNLPCLILRGVTDVVSTESGEAYGNIEIFHQRTRLVMKELLEMLPVFLQAAHG